MKYIPAKEIGIIAVIVGWIMTIISIVFIVLSIGYEGMGAVFLIVFITLIIDLVLLVGFFILILAATRGS